MKFSFGDVMAFLKKRGAAYGECRFEKSVGESVRVRDGAVEGFSRSASAGVGIRALYGGAWGFASTNSVKETDVMNAARAALSMAAVFSAVNKKKLKLPSYGAHLAKYSTPCRIDPFKVSPDEKTGLLISVTDAALRVKGITSAEAFMDFIRVEKRFVNTEGSDIRQTLLTSGGGYHVIAENALDAQKRSYPDGHHGLYASKGYELFDEIAMPLTVQRVTGEAKALLKAAPCPSGRSDIIIDGPQMALQIHESVGHPAELDRALGSEISLAGGSFLRPSMLGKYRFGSKHVNIFADPGLPEGAGSYAFDDEGIKASRVEIVKDGVFTGYLTSRESAAALGQDSNGSARADAWNCIPIVRMSNVCIEPGEVSLPELVEDTKNGILFSINKSWSIDDMRLNFQFGSEVAYEIKKGRIGRMYKNPVYFGITPEFWASCDAVCDKDYWRLWGLNSCGKGEPMQAANVGHGAAPALFRGVTIGAANE